MGFSFFVAFSSGAANFTDALRPTVAITAPTPALRTTNGLFMVRGTASDNVGLSNVQVQLNSGWRSAVTTNAWKNWNVEVPLTPGTNTIRAYSVDTAGNSSLTSSVACTYVLYGQLTVFTNGLGKVTCTPAGVPEVGKPYTLTAVPGTGFGFKNWKDGDGNVVSTNKVMQFVMTAVKVFTANFVDSTRPTVAITAPTAALRVTNAVYTVKGTAADNKAVAAVWVQLNYDSWTNASGTNAWSLPVTLSTGPNAVRAFSVDAAGNSSLTSSVACSYVVYGKLTVYTNGPGTITRSPTGAPEVNQKYTLTASPSAGFGFRSWTDGDGALVSTNKAMTFIMTTNSVFAANIVDITKPTVAITAPTAALRVTNAVYTVKGTASDNKSVAAVFCLINGGSWTNAAGTNVWSLPVALTPGTNTVRAYSVDAAGNSSLTSGVVCSYVVHGKLTVYTNGLGKVTRTPTEVPEVNKAYTLTAAPGVGWGFESWTDGEGGVVSTNRVMTFTMTTNRVFAANFKDFFEEGQSALSEFADTNSVPRGDAQLIAVAAADFDSAAKSAPLNVTNRIYNAVTIMLNLINDPSIRTQAEAYGVNLDDLFDPSCIFPAGAPAVDASVDKLAASVIPAVDKAYAELNAVPATWSGRIEISPDLYPVDEAVWVDIGDVTAMKAALKGLRAFVGLLKAYSLNVDYDRIIDPVVTPGAAITVDGSVADWAGVPLSLMTVDYSSPPAVTQEVAVALSGADIALVVTGCPFAMANSFWISFDLRMSNGDTFNDYRLPTVYLWSSGSTIEGTFNGAPIIGLDAVLSGDGILEVKFPVQDGLAVSQVTLDYVSGEMDVGVGDWQVVGSDDWFSSPQDIPITTLRAGHPEFLSKVRDAASHAGVKTDLLAALNGYLAADTLIGNRKGVNAALLHFVDFDPTDPEANEDRLVKRSRVGTMLSSLNGPVQVETDSDIEGTATRAIYLGAFFKAPYITTNMLPSGLKGTLNNPSWDAFPDPTFHGMLPGMTSAFLRKYLLGYTWASVETIRDFSAGSTSPYQLRFSVDTDRRNRTITAVTVSGLGVPVTSLESYGDGDWYASCNVTSSLAVGTRYTFTVDFSDGSQETVYDTINAWITVNPAPVISGTVLRWANASTVHNADHYYVYSSEGGDLYLPITQTSVDLSPFGYVAGEPLHVTVEIVNKNWDIATRSLDVN